LWFLSEKLPPAFRLSQVYGLDWKGATVGGGSSTPIQNIDKCIATAFGAQESLPSALWQGSEHKLPEMASLGIKS
jgi:hypothetical protein